MNARFTPPPAVLSVPMARSSAGNKPRGGIGGSGGGKAPQAQPTR
ncbi:MAG: hypothetical protein ACK4SX_07560 [Alcanivoracaceae bacterium]